MDNLKQVIRLLSDDNLVWSADLEAIRRPLADLLKTIEWTGTHQLDEEIDALWAAFSEDREPLDAAELERVEIYRQLWGNLPMRDALKRLFGAI